MANATTPYLGALGWTIDVDPDDKNFVVWDVTKDLNDRATTASGVTLDKNAVTVLQGPTIQGTTIIALIQMDVSGINAGTSVVHSATARVSCANGEQFDRTIYFNLEAH